MNTRSTSSLPKSATPDGDDWPCPPHLALPGLLAIALGTAPGAMDTAVNVAFPALTRDFGLSLEDIRWIVIPWVAAQLLLTTAFGRLGDIHGHKAVFIAGMLASALAHAACALAPDFASLALLRFMQGVAVGLGVACAPALATFLFPPRLQRRVLAAYVTAFGLAAALGPLVGGLLLDAWGWPAVFWFRVPIAIAALLLIIALPTGRATRRATGSTPPPFPFAAMRRPAFIGLHSTWVAANLAVFSVLLLAPYLLGARDTLAAAGAVGGVAGTRGGFEVAASMSYQQLGLLLALTPFGAVLAGIAGTLAGRRLVSPTALRAGLAISATSLIGVGLASPLAGDAWLAIAFVLAGFGLGLVQIGYMDLSISMLPESARGVAGSLVNVMRLAGVIGGAVILLELHRWLGDGVSPIEGHARTFMATGLALALIAIVSLWLRPTTHRIRCGDVRE